MDYWNGILEWPFLLRSCCPLFNLMRRIVYTGQNFYLTIAGGFSEQLEVFNNWLEGSIKSILRFAG